MTESESGSEDYTLPRGPVTTRQDHKSDRFDESLMSCLDYRWLVPVLRRKR